MIALDTAKPPETTEGTCLDCHWWSRNKKSKVGDCTKRLGPIVRDLQAERSRIAYPRTASSEQCDEYRQRP